MLVALYPFVPVLAVAISAVAAVVILVLPEDARRVRTTVNLTAALAKLGLLLAVVPFVFSGVYPAIGWDLLPGLRLELRADALSMLFALLGSILWLATTIYAIGYLRDDPHQRRFFSFFSLCVTATVGIAFAGNLVTFVVFYELLTLVTYPLVSHAGTPAALKAACLCSPAPCCCNSRRGRPRSRRAARTRWPSMRPPTRCEASRSSPCCSSGSA